MTNVGYDIAMEYMRKKSREGIPYDNIRNAGEKDGFEYYRLLCSSLAHHKLGRPRYVKISSNGKAIAVTRLEEIRWATHQEILLNRL